MRPMRSFIRAIYRSARSPFDYFNAHRILRRYATHYAEARQLFASTGNTSERPIKDITEVGVRVHVPEAKDNLIDLPQGYRESVARLSSDIQIMFENPKNCLFFPKLELDFVPERTRDIPAIRNGKVISLRLKNSLGVDGLQDLCRGLMRELEERIYGSHVVVDKVYIYRNLVSHQQEQVSWLWHYDNHPNEILKVMIYLTDVDEESGPFEYLRSAQSRWALCVRPMPLLGSSRVSARTLRNYISNGYEAHKVTGRGGTMILFDDNVVHRANIAKKSYRDVIVLQIRPVTFRPGEYVDPRWTGSFEHVDFNLNPYDCAPRLKT